MDPVVSVCRTPAVATALSLALAVAVLAGCQPQGSEVTTAGEPSAPVLEGADTAAGPGDGDAQDDDSGEVHENLFDDQPVEDIPPATAAALLPSVREPALARRDGYGPLRFGMSVEEMHAAGGDGLSLVAAGGAVEEGACRYLWPESETPETRPAFMIEGGRFVRYDISDAAIEAPQGGRVGMPADEVRALHAGHETIPHKYVEGGQYLRVAGDSDDVVLVFEVDAAGQVSRWRVGLPPQVDYVEGCS